MTHILLTYADGSTGIMQPVGDPDDGEVLDIIGKMVNAPTEWRRISLEEANAIRARRPKVEVPAGSAPVPTVGPDVSAELAKRDELLISLAELVNKQASQIEDLSHRAERAEALFLAIERGVAEADRKSP